MTLAPPDIQDLLEAARFLLLVKEWFPTVAVVVMVAFVVFSVLLFCAARRE